MTRERQIETFDANDGAAADVPEAPQDQALVELKKSVNLQPYLLGREYDRDVFMRETRHFLQMTLDGMIEAGRRLIVMKHMEPRGRYLEVLDEIGVPHQRASELMAICHFMTERVIKKVPESGTLGRYEKLGKSRLLLLTQIPEEILSQYEDADEIAGMAVDEIAAMSLPDLRKTVRELKEQVGKGRKQVRRLQHERDESRDKLDAIAGKKGKNLTRVEKWSDGLFELGLKLRQYICGDLYPGDEAFETDAEISCLRKADGLLNDTRIHWEKIMDRLGEE